MANSSTLGVMPGISATTITAGPSPLRNTVRSLPSWEKVVWVNPSMAEGSVMAGDLIAGPAGHRAR